MIYDPIRNAQPVSRHKLICNKARCVDGYNQDGEPVQIYRTPDDTYYRGPVVASKHEKAFYPMRLVE